MKTILIAAVIVLALVGVLSIVLYAVNHKVSVDVKDISSLPQENAKTEAVAAVKFAPLTLLESESLALMENKSLLGLSGGAFKPQFESLSSSEQNELQGLENLKPELQNLTAGDLNDNAGLGTATWAGVIIVVLVLILVF